MAISSSTRKAGPFLGNDATTVFPFAFKVFTAADLRVVNTSALGVESDLVIDVDYTVSLNADQDNDPGGSVTRLTALPTGQRLTITSDVEALQPLVLTNNGGFYPRVINDAFDKITIIAQQLIEQVGRSLKLPISSTASPTLPDPVPNSILAWNSAASGFVNIAPGDLATVSGYADARVETFNGDGTETEFEIDFNPGVLANLDISISGVTQVAGVDFTWIGTTITFAAAPPAATVVQVRYARPLSPPPALDAAVAAAAASAAEALASENAAVPAAATAVAAAGTAAADAASALASKNAAVAAQTGAETAQGLSEDARDLAQQYASDAAIVSGVNVPIYSSVASAEGATIAGAVQAIETQGFSAAGDGGGGQWKEVGSEPSHGFKFQSGDGAWWDGGGSGYRINPAKIGFLPGAAAADLATALGAAIALAMSFNGTVEVPAGIYGPGALATLPTSGELRIHFAPGCVFTAPGAGATSASDITLMSPTTSTFLTGSATFVGYRRVFDFDGIAAGSVIEARGHRYYRCGRIYNYAGASRIDFTPAFGCKVTTAATVKRLRIEDFRFDADGSDNVCDFGIVWRSGYNEASLRGIGSDGVGRMVAMMGDSSTWFKCKNLTVDGFVAQNIYQRVQPTAEYELHGILAYGRRGVFDNITVDTCYDQHATTHDAEAVYGKFLIGIANNIHIRNGGTGDAYLSMKGIVATAAQMDDPDAVEITDNVPQAFVLLSNITVQADPDFVTTHGAISGIYSNAGRIELNGFQTIGQFDRATNFTGYARVTNGTIRGACVYGVLITGAADDPEGAIVSNVTYEGSPTGAAFEYRLATTSGTVTVPLVEFNNCRARLTEGSGAPAGAFNIRVEKSTGQNRIEAVRFPGCAVYSSKTTSNPAAYAASTNEGSGANEGQIGVFELPEASAYGTNNAVRFSGTAGKIDFLAHSGGVVHSLASSMYSNPTNATKIRIGQVRCPTTNYETEKSGTATILSGASTVTITPSWNTSRQSTIMPNGINQVQLIEADDLKGAARLAVTSVNSTTGAIVVTARDAAGAAVSVSANVVFGWQAVNRYFN